MSTNETNYAAPNGEKYPLRTLRDVFELPTYEHMERCIDELKKVMLQARATNDMFAALIKDHGGPVPNGKVFLWPDVLDWEDDGKGEIGSTYTGPDGQAFFSIKAVSKKQNT